MCVHCKDRVLSYTFTTAPKIMEKGNDKETGSDGETFVNANLDNNGAQQQQVSVTKDLINGDNISTVTDNSSKLIESVNQTISPHLSSPVSMQQPSNLNDTTFANSTQQVTSKPQPTSSQKLNDTDTDMQPLLEIAYQTPDPPSTVNHLATKEEQKETNLSKLLIMYVHIIYMAPLRCNVPLACIIRACRV